MNETKHTPGSWIVNTYETNSHTNPRQVTVIAPGMTIRVSGLDQQRDANARLIAAAPDLLAVCEELLKAMVDYDMAVEEEPPYKHRQMMRRARAAIADAKGEA